MASVTDLPEAIYCKMRPVAIAINWLCTAVIYLASIPVSFKYVYALTCKRETEYTPIDNQTKDEYSNYPLAINILFNLVITVTLLHAFNVLKTITATETGIISFFAIIAIIICIEQYLINSNTIKFTAEETTNVNDKKLESLNKKVSIVWSFMNSDYKDDNDNNNDYYSKETWHKHTKLHSNTNVSSTVKKKTKSLSQNIKKSLPRPNDTDDDDESLDKLREFEVELFEWFNIDDDINLDKQQLKNVVVHYVSIAIMFSLFIAYLTDAIIKLINQDEMLSYSLIYEFIAVVFANFIGGYKILSLFVNWFLKSWIN